MSFSTSLSSRVFLCLLFLSKRSRHQPTLACRRKASPLTLRYCCAFPKLTCTPQLRLSRALIAKDCMFYCEGQSPYSFRVISSRASRWRPARESEGRVSFVWVSRYSILESVQEQTSSMRWASSRKTVSRPSACPSFFSRNTRASQSSSTIELRLLMLRVWAQEEILTRSEMRSLLFSSEDARVNLSASCWRLPTGTLWASSILLSLLKKSRIASSSPSKYPFTCSACRTAPFLLTRDFPLLWRTFLSSSFNPLLSLSPLFSSALLSRRASTTTRDSGIDSLLQMDLRSSWRRSLMALIICSQVEWRESSPRMARWAAASSCSTCLRARQCWLRQWQVACSESSIIFLPQEVSSRTASSTTGSEVAASRSMLTHSQSKRLRRYCCRVSNYYSHDASII